MCDLCQTRGHSSLLFKVQGRQGVKMTSFLHQRPHDARQGMSSNPTHILVQETFLFFMSHISCILCEINFRLDGKGNCLMIEKT